MKARFDTHILVDYLNGLGLARAELLRYPQVAISLVTWMDLLVGTRPDDEAVVRRFLSRFEGIPIDTEIAERAVIIRRTTRVRLPDPIIRATAECEHALLVTRNTRDFPEGEPWVRVPYRL